MSISNVPDDSKLLYQLEALKLVKEWSTGLIFVQSAAIAVVGGLLQNKPPNIISLLIAIILFVFLIASIFMGAVSVVGTIPYIVQNLPNDIEEDIYRKKGGLKFKKFLFIKERNLGNQCTLQANLFTISFIFLVIFIITHSLGL